MEQFIKVRFGPLDERRYTYVNNGEHYVALGDMVKVPEPRGDGWKRVEVMEIDVEKPTKFECRAILGFVTDADTDRRTNPAPAPEPTGPLI